MRRITDRGPVFYQFDQWPEENGLVHGVFTRLGGVSAKPWQSLNVGNTVGDDPDAVRRNKQLMFEALDIDSHNTSTTWLAHGAETIIVTEPTADRASLARADGMVTNRPDITLVMRFADCVPILLYDPVRAIIGLAHAGWRGTALGAGPSAAQTMIEDFDCRPEDIQAGIGPSIGPERYEIGEEVVQAIQEAFDNNEDLFRYTNNGSAHLDLWTANQRALNALGITQVEVANICTASRTDEWFSHRAERGQTGRFGVVLTLRSSTQHY